ncbi:hypothetical protein H072_3949 [Dactylellina haptotyla CBS 200.50]|uniref:BTB domain-containing protein n=1 Tax=Dactylellina haptotyla (strain CBS 200.50) TaxID=1284197 RepID=S8BRF7_DACHA|nr:hypothetical protein H072_3949 [Dactylellina haptotyla CBS 200.50]
MEELLNSGKFSDFRIKCRGKEWKVHRAIICPQSKYFATMCESDFKEARDAELDLSSESQIHVGQMLEYLYTGSYSVDEVLLQETGNLSGIQGEVDIEATDDQTLKISSLRLRDNWDEDDGVESTVQIIPQNTNIQKQMQHISLYAMGDRYLIEKLKDKAANNFKNELPNSWSPEYWPVIEYIHENFLSNDTRLQGPIVDLWVTNSTELLNDVSFCEKLATVPNMELVFLRKHAVKLNERLKAFEQLSREVSTLTSELDRTKRVLDTTNQARQAMRKSLADGLLPMTEHWSQCRHCSADFNGVLEETGNTVGCQLIVFIRCRKCRTKHNLGGQGQHLVW